MLFKIPSNISRLVAFIFLIVVIFYLIWNSNLKEGFMPWTWNIPTRNIYPPIGYDLRCQPSPIIHHIYRQPGYTNSYYNSYYNGSEYPNYYNYPVYNSYYNPYYAYYTRYLY